MNVPRAFLAAVGAFWSELIPAPSLWDYEGSALADREAAVEVWEPSHADYDDDADDGDSAYSEMSAAFQRALAERVRKKFPSAAVTVPAVAAVPAGVSADPPVLVPPAGLPFTFNANELVDTASEIINDHYCRNGVRLAFTAMDAAKVVVSQLVADLTAAYTEAQK